MQSLLDWLDSAALALALSLYGGLAFAARKRESSLRGWLCCTLLGSFSGIISYIILTELFPAVSQLTATALSSFCASTGGLYLDTVMSNLATHTTDKLTKKD